MKKYVIQDVEDKKYYCDNDTWSDDVNDAVTFMYEESAFDKAYELNLNSKYIVTVIAVII